MRPGCTGTAGTDLQNSSAIVVDSLPLIIYCKAQAGFESRHRVFAAAAWCEHVPLGRVVVQAWVNSRFVDSRRGKGGNSTVLVL